MGPWLYIMTDTATSQNHLFWRKMRCIMFDFFLAISTLRTFYARFRVGTKKSETCDPPTTRTPRNRRRHDPGARQNPRPKWSNFWRQNGVQIGIKLETKMSQKWWPKWFRNFTKMVQKGRHFAPKRSPSWDQKVVQKSINFQVVSLRCHLVSIPSRIKTTQGRQMPDLRELEKKSDAKLVKTLSKMAQKGRQKWHKMVTNQFPKTLPGADQNCAQQLSKMS